MPAGKMKKWTALGVVLLLALLAYVAAGPWLSVRAIRAAIQQQDASALSKEVDFPALRGNLKAQLQDAMLRKAGPDAQASPFGNFALAIAGGVVNGIVDLLVTPAGLAAMMEGRRVWRKFDDGFSPPPTDAEGRPLPAPEPLQGARYRYESPSRFTATVADENDEPIVFVFRRDGLRWRLTDIRLPLADDEQRL
jgi:hypothetical protein